MMDIINKIIIFIWSLKWKLLGLVAVILAFTFLLFPFKDLNDFISSQVSAATAKKVYLQFDDMSINPITTSITLDKVALESGDIDNLNIEQLTAAPSIMALLKRQPGGRIKAQGLFGGTAEIEISPNGKSAGGGVNAIADIHIQKISLKDLKNTLKLNQNINGKATLKSKIALDSTFTEQPDGDYSIQIDNVELNSLSINTPNFGSLTLPDFKFKSVELKGKISNGKFVIESGKIGAASDDMSGTIKGHIDISFKNQNGQIQPVIGAYEFNVELAIKSAFKERAQFMLVMLNDNLKTEESGLTRYKFKVSANSSFDLPQMTPLN